jgi:hypothetical protein
MPIIKIFKSVFGLHSATFNAPVYKMLHIRTMFSVGFT